MLNEHELLNLVPLKKFFNPRSFWDFGQIVHVLALVLYAIHEIINVVCEKKNIHGFEDQLNGGYYIVYKDLKTPIIV
jgi:hypothetical protein